MMMQLHHAMHKDEIVRLWRAKEADGREPVQLECRLALGQPKGKLS